MSEYINNYSLRKEMLKNIILQLHSGHKFADLKSSFHDLLKDATAQEIVQIEQALISEGLPVEQIQFLCDAHVALFKESLDEQLPSEMLPGHPIFTFRAENEFAELQLRTMDEIIEELISQDNQILRQKFAVGIQNLEKINRHYLRKENLLFPMLEKYSFSGPSSVMWGIHDEIRTDWKKLEEQITKSPIEQISSTYAKVKQAVHEMIYKENHILFPNALEQLSEKDWEIIYQGEEEIGFAFVIRGNEWKPEFKKESGITLEKRNEKEIKMEKLTLKVGNLSAQQIDLMLQNLPIDVTFVDENDEVAFYSQSRERIFARTPAVIGRKVQMCHPPASVDKVQKILDDFRAGKRDEAGFWIQMNGKFIHIRYFAIYDEEGVYRGTIEVTQDITEIQKLEGEKRLLDD